MKILWILLLSAWSCAAALPPGTTGKMIHEYPNNPVPPATYQVLEDPGNGAYQQSTLGQIFATFGGTDNNTNFALLIGQNGTNFTLLTSNLLYQQIVSSTNLGFILNFNGNGTNTTNWGVSSYQELDVLTAYLTNLFTFITNAPFVKTDGDGKLVVGSILSGTNLNIAPGVNITFITNGSGQVTIAASGTISAISAAFDNLTVTNGLTNLSLTASTAVLTDTGKKLVSLANGGNNTVLHGTSPPAYSSVANADLANSSLTIAGTANQVSVSGGGPVSLGGTATLSLPSPIITPGSFSAPQITNTSFAASGVVTNDANGKEYTTPTLQNALLANSSITVQNSAVSLGGSTLAQGSKPVFDLQSSTNLLLSSVSSPTNGVSTASSIDFTLAEAVTNIAGAVSQTSVVNFNQTNINHAIRYYVNRTGSDQTITVGTWETDSGRQTATTYICTNNTTLGLMFSMYAGQFTNVTSYKTFR